MQFLLNVQPFAHFHMNSSSNRGGNLGRQAAIETSGGTAQGRPSARQEAGTSRESTGFLESGAGAALCGP
jgi:hypothetical protein